MKINLKLNQIALISSLAFAVTATYATTESITATIPVEANVIAGCIIQTNATLALGDYDPVRKNATEALEKSVEIGMNCTKGSAAEFSVSGNENLTQTDIKAGETADMLEYKLTYAAKGTSETFNKEETASFTGKGSKEQQIYVVNVSVKADQNVNQGKYSDDLTATLKF